MLDVIQFFLGIIALCILALAAFSNFDPNDDDDDLFY